MKKLLFISALFLISCSKDKGLCYECEFGFVNGVKPENEIHCGNVPTNFVDAQGNPLQAFCKPF